ncbi:crotonase/enoyl-CoA hydratase family protein [SAR86 cluster bacterium]|jgi:enoyl-CoA hydratase/carnithine racemase|nr:crotonase/enoyl-CoA hydratase family protein [SAR86 cluster bacterium]
MNTYKEIKTEIKEKSLIIYLSRQEKMNTFTKNMQEEIVNALDAAEENDEIRSIIFTGDGKAFCAGADLSSGGDTFDSSKAVDKSVNAIRDSGGLLTLRLFKSTKPLIGAINGVAVGIGATMLLPMDVRICSNMARFGFVFTKRGIVPEAASSWFLPRLIGIENALKLCYSGKVISAEEAKDYKLVSEIVSGDNLIDRALEIAKEFTAESSQISIALTRQLLWRMLGADDPMEAHKIDSRAVFELGKSGEAMEGVMSFLEKRPPEFPGKISKDMPSFYPWWIEKEFE